jgi:RNA polymerase sigma-70 factor (ECF subfamily)
LLARLQAGEALAFEACVRAYCPRLLIVARRLLRDEVDAQDVVQEAFLAAFKGLGQFQRQARLSTWLHRIVINAALGRLRASRRHPEKPLEDLLPHFGEGEHQLDPPVPWDALPEAILQSRETCEIVQVCINQLPESYRIVLLLRDIEGLATEETSRLLALSTAVVKTRLHRARQALRTLLDPHYRRGNV